MRFLYDFCIHIYKSGIAIASRFNTKANLFFYGRKGLMERIAKEVKSDSPIIWVHCSSVGEFEQARPVIEWLKANEQKYKILLTFFSPSGYELRKNYILADWVYYMPVDTAKNARNFVKSVNPQKAIFIKYEFWYNHLRELKENNVETYIVSAIFRPRQIFFKWYGGFFRNMLKYFTTIFVQDEQSMQLLNSIGLKENVIVCGDTRFDRVHEIVAKSKNIPIIEEFAKGSFTLVAGSSWEPDEEIIADVLKNFSKIKLILVPHEIGSARTNKILQTFEQYKTVVYSSIMESCNTAATESCNTTATASAAMITGSAPETKLPEDVCAKLAESKVIIIDTLGMLSSIYKYGDCAYIGGGFGVGIHNILEAATYGMPVIFGPNYRKFKEAKDLIKLHGVYSVRSNSELYGILTDLIGDKNLLALKGNICRNYVESNLGATKKITETIFK